jgi:hypothetical protein
VRDGILIREITNEEEYRLLPIVRAFVGIGGDLAQEPGRTGRSHC